jgi:hypothetical protein
VTFQAKAPHKKRRWLALLAIVMLGTGAAVTSVSAAVPADFGAFTPDDEGANDEPGQKDLTAQDSVFESGTNDFYSAWKWDDTSWSGNNTGDACSLFDTDDDGLVNFAVCVTIGTKQATELSTRVYSCGDTRSDRCTGSVLEGTESSPNYCTVQPATGQFDATDTLAFCNITVVATTEGIADLDSGTLLNSCSYPSQQPNSDPSDCVLTITNLNTSLTTRSSGTATWSATLNDLATLNPTSATGSVVFKLWTTNSCNDATPVWESAPVTVRTSATADATHPIGTASTVGAATATGTTGSNIITQATTDSDLTFWWTTDFTPTGAFNGTSSSCGEATTITPASVSGASG